MRLRILGCHGGESPEHHNTSFLVDDTILIDAGALTRSLDVAAQVKIDHVFLSHVHLDHIRDLAMLSDNVIGLRPTPVTIHCSPFTAQALQTHFFNNVIWPDFTKIPNPADPLGGPTLRIAPFAVGSRVAMGAYTFTTVPVHHPVDCQALFLSGDFGTFVYSGDTGPTQAMWQALNALTDLRALVTEVSFVDGMEKLAQVSGHLTPSLLGIELQKFHPKAAVPILLYHMKPSAEAALRGQIAALNHPNLQMLAPGQTFEWRAG